MTARQRHNQLEGQRVGHRRLLLGLQMNRPKSNQPSNRCAGEKEGETVNAKHIKALWPPHSHRCCPQNLQWAKSKGLIVHIWKGKTALHLFERNRVLGTFIKCPAVCCALKAYITWLWDILNFAHLLFVDADYWSQNNNVHILQVCCFKTTRFFLKTFENLSGFANFMTDDFNFKTLN